MVRKYQHLARASKGYPFSAEWALFRVFSLGEAKKANLGHVFGYLIGCFLRFCKSMVKFITSNAIFTAGNQGYGRSDGEMETYSFELAGPLPFPGVDINVRSWGSGSRRRQRPRGRIGRGKWPGRTRPGDNNGPGKECGGRFALPMAHSRERGSEKGIPTG